MQSDISVTSFLDTRSMGDYILESSSSAEVLGIRQDTELCYQCTVAGRGERANLILG